MSSDFMQGVESCVVRYGAVLHRQEKRLTADGGRGKEAVRLRHRAEKCRHSSVRQLSFWGHLIRAVMPIIATKERCILKAAVDGSDLCYLTAQSKAIC
ncbi:unnamed protein product [Toxocara canis]|uniref:Uncharacterized protein n=1 Tax=Toxocara canis TaxID=6265 RepID=A0A183UQC5_TOXCA|nr:unnamed protein product [Toxocara canis]